MPPAKRWHETAVDPGAQVPAAAGEVTSRRGRRVGSGAPTSIPPAALLPVPLHPQDSVKTQRPTHGPPKLEGDAVSHLRSRCRAARRQLGCAGDTKANTSTTERHRGVTRRLPASALPSQPSPHLLSRRILRRSLQSPRAGGDPGRLEGRSAPRGCIREVVSMIGICLPNGATNTPGCALTDFSSSQ